MGQKNKNIGGREYKVLGSTIERQGFNIVRKSYTTTVGVVIVENGKVSHPDGTKTNEH